MEKTSRIAGLKEQIVTSDGGSLYVEMGGSGPPVLLLHGFPQTGLMWRDIAPRLAKRFTTVVADLPGYGRSSSPQDGMSKRAMASMLVNAMQQLGHRKSAVVGHDRGGRVAYRAALDHPDRVSRLAVLDVIPTLEVWERVDDRAMLAFWPFALLAQPEPLPERLIAGAPDAIVDNALQCWGSPESFFPEEVRSAYVDALRDPVTIHTICEEYRAAAGIDRDHDAADREAGRRIAQPLLAVWGATGGLAQWYADSGGPLGIWRCWADDVRGQAIDGGHFFPEECAEQTVGLLTAS